MKTTAAQMNALRIAATNGVVVVHSPNRATEGTIAGSTFAALARAGLLTHWLCGTPEPGFSAWVGGTRAYLTTDGRKALA